MMMRDVTANFIREYLKESDIILLPIGGTEQHGRHSPCGTDAFIAEGIAQRVGEKANVLVAPTIPYGSHPYFHYGMVGTIPISETLQIQLVVEILKQLSKMGFNKIIIVNSHGQWHVLEAVVQMAVRETGSFVAVASYFHIAAQEMKKVLKTPLRHAEETETSIMLELHPELIDMSQAVKDTGDPPLVKRELLMSDGCFRSGNDAFPLMSISAYPLETLRPIGVMGDPTIATKEKGKAIVDAGVNKIVELIDDLKERYPAGVKVPLGDWPDNIPYK